MGRQKLLLLFVGLCLGHSSLYAQDFTLLHRKFQVHGFASQGFIHTDNNNWLTLNTSHTGSGQFTDFGANISVQVTHKLRIGGQIYDRNLGQLGRWHPSLDWAYADYRFQPWFGVRGGKVKTPLGLYNDTQDLDFLHPFVLLPQSVYPTDLRESTIAHTGGDLYGTIRLRNSLGSLSYVAYAGQRQDSHDGGYPYLLKGVQIFFSSYGGLQYGGDLRWTTPLPGLIIGGSRLNESISGKGTAFLPGTTVITPYEEHSIADWANQFYGRYSFRRLQLDAEWRRYWRDQRIAGGFFEVQNDVRGAYLAGSYRVKKWFQLGSYYSRYSINLPVFTVPGLPYHSGDKSHIYDRVVAARFDLNSYTNFKIEGHFMDGFGLPAQYPAGFYELVNEKGFQPKTNALVLKTGFNF